MVIFLVLTAVLAAMAVVYFAFEASRVGHIAQMLEGENADLRGRIANLVVEVRRLRESSGLPFETFAQSSADELMPLRRAGRGGVTRSRTMRSGENPDVVAVVCADPAEQKRLSNDLTANGYRVAESTIAEIPRYAHELSTAALIFDLRNMGIATGARVILAAFATDPIAKEVPVFALVANNIDRERLIDEGVFTSAFLVPTDTALLASNLGAASIRRRTRARRVEAARPLSLALASP
ncbi:MAG: hypothetical protein H7145_17235 [Akkermansiaceae bacterium]|nr:hypothetical protein [Armatimonadota bacterium]